MKFQLSTSLIIASVASFAAAGPFTIRWYSGRGCTGASLGCNSYNAFQCCEEPPYPSGFPSMRATSAGPPGVLVFTEVAQDGGCGLCSSTGSINQCYLNSPFETAFVASITQCQPPHKRGLDRREKVETLERYSECNSTVPLDTASLNGYDYDLTGDDRLEIMHDILNMDAPDFEKKWEGSRKGAVSAGTSTTKE
ncbi:uncharacterized protein GGS25DRAFT_530427 [Hypoxylon fragiforme]|uniref:uncharacterized protein n=1 Tax=Hypoxylon fragiforme TaxID=63214 RepID=UPI0020C72482|nr:uncharacterized protein GGS25DRAFT_530427 [Hypoxylon fragiforme]KAI2611690.1 hypothetical protein GGS25DRAFT_530427 [Hypoxylon fragiforme]